MPAKEGTETTRSHPRGARGREQTQAARRHWTRRALSLLPLLALAVILSACTFKGEAMTIDPKSLEGKDIHSLYALVFWLATAVFIIVEFMLFYSVVRFRRRPGAGLPAQIHGNNRVEAVWTIIPVVLLLIVAIPTVRLIVREASPAPADATHIKIIGHQFWWEVQYPDTKPEIITANEIHIPVNKTVEFELTSADVQHAFWVPLMGSKMDVYPNRVNRLKFTPTETGNFFGQCSELCGEGHGFMKMRVMVQNNADFQAWTMEQQRIPVTAAGPATPGAATPGATPGVATPTAARPSGPTPTLVPPTPKPHDPKYDDPALIAKGRTLVVNGACAGCHTIDGTNAKGKVGPNLTHVGDRTTIVAGWLENTPDDIMKWVHDPQNVKPGALMPAFPNFSQEDLEAIAAYLTNLR